MEFSLIEDNKHVYFIDYKDWDEPLLYKNSRAFKRTFNQSKYEKFELYWSLSNYMGPAAPGSFYMRSWGERSKYVITDLTVEMAARYLNSIGKIAGVYQPVEGDEISIWRQYLYKEINNVLRPRLDPNTITFIYRGNMWVSDSYQLGIDNTKLLLRGKLSM